MKVLAVDSSGEVGSLALIETGRVASEELLGLRESRGESLGRVARQLLQRSGFRARELDIIVAGIGPGSYTGIRMAVAFAKTLAYALERPLVGLSGLMAIARDSSSEGRVLGVLETGHRTRLYAAAYRFRGDLADEIVPVGLWEHERFLDALPAGTLLTGSQSRALLPLIAARGLETATSQEPYRVRALTLARLGLAHHAAGRPLDDPMRLEPLYLQPSAPERGKS